MYYNTTNVTGTALLRNKRKTETQEDKVLKLYKIAPGRPMGPNLITKLYNDNYTSVPATSIRRAITNLTKAGKLIKTDSMEMGGYGKLEHTWKLSVDG